MATLKIVNDYLLLEKKTGEKRIEKSAFISIPQVNNNFGVVRYADEKLENLVGKSFYFKNQFEHVIFEGKELLVMKQENLIAEKLLD